MYEGYHFNIQYINIKHFIKDKKIIQIHCNLYILNRLLNNNPLVAERFRRYVDVSNT